MKPHESGISSSPGRRYQDIHHPDLIAHPGFGQAMLSQRGQACEHATRTGIEQRGHLARVVARLTGVGQVHAGEQEPPGSAIADPVLQDPLGHAAVEGLPSGDHALLLA
jgi:hypothetical protein